MKDKEGQPTNSKIDYSLDWDDPDHYRWKDFTLDKRGRVVRKRQGPGPVWLTINLLLKFLTYFVIVAGWILIGFLFRIDSKVLPYFLIVSSYIHVILSKFVFQWP